MIDQKKYENIVKARCAIDIINKRLFPIAEFPLLDKFIVDAMIKRRRLYTTFPQWTNVNQLPIGLVIISLYVLILVSSSHYNSLLFFGIGALACMIGYRAKWILDRLDVLSQHKTTKKAVLIAATGLTPMKMFNAEYDEDFLKPVLLGYLSGNETNAFQFINMYAELTHALNPSEMEINLKKQEFDQLIKQSPWMKNAESVLDLMERKKPTKLFSRHDKPEFITKDMTISNNNSFAIDDQVIESSLANLLSENDITDSISPMAKEASDSFLFLLENEDWQKEDNNTVLLSLAKKMNEKTEVELPQDKMQSSSNEENSSQYVKPVDPEALETIRVSIKKIENNIDLEKELKPESCKEQKPVSGVHIITSSHVTEETNKPVRLKPPVAHQLSENNNSTIENIAILTSLANQNHDISLDNQDSQNKDDSIVNEFENKLNNPYLDEESDINEEDCDEEDFDEEDEEFDENECFNPEKEDFPPCCLEDYDNLAAFEKRNDDEY